MTEMPLQRTGEPAEIASMALFHASGMSPYKTCTLAEITGGRSM
jgi:3-oxoacyl-[acyl-carrier protein] reductase